MDYSVSNYLKFIDKLDEYINPETSKNITSLSFRLLDGVSVNEDIRNIDFESIVKEKYPDESITDKAKKMYIGRMNSGLRYFTQYVKGEKVQVTRGSKTRKLQNKLYSTNKDNNVSVQFFSLPIPLREGIILNVTNLPLDLTNDEADKISRIIKSYATIKND